MLNLVSKLFLPCLALVASASTSFAVPVNYNTAGSVFTCNGAGAGNNDSPTCLASAVAGGSTVTFTSGGNSATLSYFDFTTVSPINPNPSANSQFGDFSWTGNTTVLLGKNSGSNLADFTLRVNQSLPTPGFGTVNSDVKGNIKLVAPDGGMRLVFAGGFITIGGIVYTPTNETLINSNPFPIKTTLNGTVDASAVPEPGFYGLLSLGMAGLYAAVRRRRNATV